MNDFGLLPNPAQWALDAGLPAPRPDEGFAHYVSRLGLDAATLVADLTEQTICLANWRLNTRLQRDMRAAFDAHVSELSVKHMDASRRREIRHAAKVLWGDRCRPVAVV